MALRAAPAGCRPDPSPACLQMQKDIRTNLLIFFDSASEKQQIAATRVRRLAKFPANREFFAI
jgi:hypothetical protein